MPTVPSTCRNISYNATVLSIASLELFAINYPLQFISSVGFFDTSFNIYETEHFDTECPATTLTTILTISFFILEIS